MKSNLQNKNQLSLNGNWKYIKDAEKKLSLKNIKNLLSGNKKLPEMFVPSNWQLNGLNNFNGSVWFIKKFYFDNKNNDDLKVLKFFGVDYFTETWLNWKFIGSHEGYFQPFSFFINNFLVENSSANILVVKVSSPFEIPGKVWPNKKKLIKGVFNHHDCRPGGTDPKFGQDQNTGGIWNDVLLKFGYKVFIENVKISSYINYKNNSANLLFNIDYTSSLKFPEKLKVNGLISILSKEINKKFTLAFMPGTNNISFSIKIKNPKLWFSWDLGKPNLYKIKISSEAFEEQNLNFGIREVHLDEKKQFYLNGKKLFLRGTNIIPTQFLSSLTKQKISSIVKLIKEANINIVRVHAHVNRTELYEEFDKQGILLWQDFSLQWTYDESEKFIANAVNQIKDMVNLLYNHSSIAFWCCHNEPGDQIYLLDKHLHQAVLNEDVTRIVRTASNYEEHAYDGWYWGNKEHYAAAPMGPLVTEFGAQAIPNLSSLKKFIPVKKIFPPDWKAWKYHNFQIDQTFNIANIEIGNSVEDFISNSQKYQADVLQTAIDFYRRKKFSGINGIFQFMFIDCWPSITWSVVDFYEKKKLGYEILKICYQPVYISVNLWQKKYFKGKKMNFSLYIINDVHKKFNKCKLCFFLNDKLVYNVLNINIKENDLIHFEHSKFNIILPEKIRLGKHLIKIELKEKNKIISQNSFEIEVVKNLE